jgi:hypothetical protein
MSICLEVLILAICVNISAQAYNFGIGFREFQREILGRVAGIGLQP